MRGCRPAHRLGDDRHIGNLRSHPDHEREVDEVLVVRLLSARKR
jgi:hypothetical protein